MRFRTSENDDELGVENTTHTFGLLPPALQYELFSFLTPKELTNLSSCAKFTYEAVRTFTEFLQIREANYSASLIRKQNEGMNGGALSYLCLKNAWMNYNNRVVLFGGYGALLGKEKQSITLWTPTNRAVLHVNSLLPNKHEQEAQITSFYANGYNLSVNFLIVVNFRSLFRVQFLGNSKIAFQQVNFPSLGGGDSNELLRIGKVCILNEYVLITPFNEKQLYKCALLTDSENDGAVWLHVLQTLTFPRNKQPGIERVVKLSASGDHFLVLSSFNKVYGFGNNANHRFSPTLEREVKTNLIEIETRTTASHAVSTAAGMYHSLVLHNDGRVYAIGENTAGQLGLLTYSNATTYLPLRCDDFVISIASSNLHSLILTKRERGVFGFGMNAFNQLGQEVQSFWSCYVPRKVSFSEEDVVDEDRRAAPFVLHMGVGPNYSLLVDREDNVFYAGTKDCILLNGVASFNQHVTSFQKIM